MPPETTWVIKGGVIANDVVVLVVSSQQIIIVYQFRYHTLLRTDGIR